MLLYENTGISYYMNAGFAKMNEVFSCQFLVYRLQHDNEHYRAFTATNKLSSYLASMNNNARYDSSTDFLEL